MQLLKMVCITSRQHTDLLLTRVPRQFHKTRSCSVELLLDTQMSLLRSMSFAASAGRSMIGQPFSLRAGTLHVQLLTPVPNFEGRGSVPVVPKFILHYLIFNLSKYKLADHGYATSVR